MRLKILWNLSISNLRHNKQRTVIIFLSIVLSVSVFAAILTLNETMNARSSTSVTIIYGAIAVFLSYFLIYNNFSMSVQERLRVLGVMRSIGAPRHLLALLVLTEAILIGFIASIIGLNIGFFLALLTYYVSARGPSITAFVFSWQTLFNSVLMGLLVSMLAAALPAIKASKVSSLAAIYPDREDGVGLFERFSFLIGIIGLILSLISVFAFTANPANDLLRGLGFVGIFLFLLSVVLISPTLVKPFLGLIGNLILKINRLGMLVIENLKINRKRIIIATAVMLIGITIVLFGQIYNGSREEGNANLSRSWYAGDVRLSYTSFNDDQLRAQNEALRGLTSSERNKAIGKMAKVISNPEEYFTQGKISKESADLIDEKIKSLPYKFVTVRQSATASYYIVGNKAQIEPLVFSFINPEKYEKFVKFRSEEMGSKSVVKVLKRGEAVISLNTAKFLDLKKGQKIRVVLLNKSVYFRYIAYFNQEEKIKTIIKQEGIKALKKGTVREIKIGAVVKNNPASTSYNVFIDDRVLKDKFYLAQNITNYHFKANHNQEVMGLKKSLKNTMKSLTLRNALTNKPEKSERAAFVSAKKEITLESSKRAQWAMDPQGVILYWGLVAMVALTSILAISVTVANGVIERQKEIALLKAIGVGARQIKVSIIIETMILSFIGWGVGFLASLTISLIAVQGSSVLMSDYGVNVPMLIPKNFVLLSFVSVIVIGLISAIHPAKKAASINIIENLPES